MQGHRKNNELRPYILVFLHGLNQGSFASQKMRAQKW